MSYVIKNMYKKLEEKARKSGATTVETWRKFAVEVSGWEEK